MFVCVVDKICILLDFRHYGCWPSNNSVYILDYIIRCVEISLRDTLYYQSLSSPLRFSKANKTKQLCQSWCHLYKLIVCSGRGREQ